MASSASDTPGWVKLAWEQKRGHKCTAETVAKPPATLGVHEGAQRSDAHCAAEPGKDAFHRVPDFGRNEWDAMERALAILEDRLRVLRCAHSKINGGL
jgi:hypothetical protein